jgi:hypothetical protein
MHESSEQKHGLKALIDRDNIRLEKRDDKKRIVNGALLLVISMRSKDIKIFDPNMLCNSCIKTRQCY